MNPTPRLFAALVHLPVILGISLGSALPVRAGLIYATNFGAGANPWPAWTVTATPGVVIDRYYSTQQGTIDTRNGSGGSCLVFDGRTSSLAPGAAWSVTTRSGPVPRQAPNTVTDLASLTLGVDLQGNRQGRVAVRISSLNASNAVTGTLETTFELARWNTWQRFTADLSAFTLVSGVFDAAAPAFEYAFVAGSTLGWSAPAANNIVKVDNLTLSAPSFYVQAGGTVAHPTGRSETSPFTTLQAAVDAAVPGDVIHIMNPVNGATYVRPSHATIAKTGAPAGWIVIRSHPGHRPELVGTDWNNIKISWPAAYIEIRDLVFRGNRANVTEDEAWADFDKGTVQNGAAYYGSGATNGNGIGADGRQNLAVTRPDGSTATITDPDKGLHHLRFIRNTVSDHCGAGISAIHADHVVIEDNIVYRNSYYTRYATSGISIFRSWNFDQTSDTKNFVLRNETFANRCYIYWIDTNPYRLSDGNGIIIDDNLNAQSGASGVPYLGRTLVANNLAYGNGGAGIQAFQCRYVDIFNNTAYYNSQSPELNYGQIYAGSNSTDVNVADNVWWAQNGKTIELIARAGSTGIAYRDNLVYGDGNNLPGGGDVTNTTTATLVRSGNVFAAPAFLNPSLDSAAADFRLAATSPAVDSAAYTANGVPRSDRDFVARPLGSAPDRGALEGGHSSRQAELYTGWQGCTFNPVPLAGDTGTGYIDYGGNGSFVEWNNFNVPSAGAYRLVVRYSNGSLVNRSCALVINGAPVATLPFPPTGDWAAWDLLAVDVSLNAGNNTLRLTANTTNGGPNLDRLDAARR